MEKKPSRFSFFFKRLNKKTSHDAAAAEGSAGAWRWKKRSTGSRWKRRFNLHLWFVDSFLFKIMSALEAVVLVSKLCFFFLCCGCHF